MGSISAVLARAQERAQQANLPYHGALTPQEAHLLLTLAPQAKLVDVRARAEWDLTGVIPGSVQVEWQTYPGWHPNPYFIQQLEQLVDKEALLMFICRSGGRSHKAAEAAARAGFLECYNILEGFEGDRDKVTQQRNINGWKKAGLPWVQS
ncbi:MAG: rhodanese-like domain-containing protein [Burkholderiales bacterium]